MDHVSLFILVIYHNAQQHSPLRQGAVHIPPDKTNPASQDAQDLKSPRVKEISSIFLPPFRSNDNCFQDTLHHHRDNLNHTRCRLESCLDIMRPNMLNEYAPMYAKASVSYKNVTLIPVIQIFKVSTKQTIQFQPLSSRLVNGAQACLVESRAVRATALIGKATVTFKKET